LQQEIIYITIEFKLQEVVIENVLVVEFTVIIGDYKKAYDYPIGKEKTVKVYKFIDKDNPDYAEYLKITTDPEINTVLTEKYLNDLWHFNSRSENSIKLGQNLYNTQIFGEKVMETH